MAVFANLGSFSVSASSSDLIRNILADRKAAATARSRDEGVMIRPVRRKRTSLHDDKA